jgi:predicted phosphodiesterase
MKVAALYDVHAMPWALEAVLAELGDVDAIVFGGDFVGGPCVDETLALIGSLDATLVRGNAEDGDERTASLPLTAELDGVTYCHATPTANTPMTTVFTPDEDLRAMFGERGTFVIGHTHHQFDRRAGDLRVVNAGSVGMAYEGEVAAFWALVTDGEPELRRTPFDIERAIAGIRASGWGKGEEFIAENLLVAVDRDEAARHFESQR